MDYIITDIYTLRRLRLDRDLKRTVRKIVLKLEGIENSRIYERQINQYYFACGCQEGSLAVFLSMLIFGALWWLSGFDAMPVWWIIVLSLMLTSVVGKILGLLMSRYRLNKALSDLEIRLTRL